MRLHPSLVDDDLASFIEVSPPVWITAMEYTWAWSLLPLENSYQNRTLQPGSTAAQAIWTPQICLLLNLIWCSMGSPCKRYLLLFPTLSDLSPEYLNSPEALDEKRNRQLCSSGTLGLFNVRVKPVSRGDSFLRGQPRALLQTGAKDHDAPPHLLLPTRARYMRLNVAASNVSREQHLPMEKQTKTLYCTRSSLPGEMTRDLMTHDRSWSHLFSALIKMFRFCGHECNARRILIW